MSNPAALAEGEKILVVDDDARLRRLLERFLDEQGYRVRAVENTEQMDRLLSRELFQLVVLDLMLPGEDGLTACRRLREQNNQVPIIMLTAKGDEGSRIQGLELGADDYLAKPCDPRELTARLRAVLRRTHPAQPSAQMQLGDLSLNLTRGVAQIDGQEISLTLSESRILEALLRQPGEPLDKQALAQLALGRKLTLYDRSLDMHVSNLRKKLGSHPDGSPRILALRGRGYYYSH
ncbi:response regulator [Pseudomonas aeruginosa]|uniref:response regulator n=27 Tax=Pseudomonadota TaxID=1224 RepID=UPI00062859DB|nr:response regulator [Pseudomonas aeruginosa]